MKTASWTYLLPKVPRAAGPMAPLKLPLWRPGQKLGCCPDNGPEGYAQEQAKRANSHTQNPNDCKTAVSFEWL